MADNGELERLGRERDLYRSLLGRDEGVDPKTMLSTILEVAVRSANATRGLVAVYSDAWEPGDAPLWQVGMGSGFSQRLIHDTLASGRAAHVASLSGHPAYAQGRSVLSGNLQSALCTPLSGVLGVLYLQDREGGGSFTGLDFARITELVTVVGPALRRGLRQGAIADPSDPTSPWRHGGRFAGLVGKSPAFAKVLETAVRLADLPGSAVVFGPQGTGRSALAAAIHQASPRARQPLVRVGCAALVDRPTADEVLGSVEGGGLLARARGGTLVLDDVDRLSKAVLARVLPLFERTLDGEVPLVRVVATFAGSGLDRTVPHHRDLLGVISGSVTLPSLAERAADIPLLVEHFGEAAESAGLYVWPGLTEEAAAFLASQPWPGNLIQLQDAVERLAAASSNDGPIQEAAARLVLGAKRTERRVGVDRFGVVLSWEDAKDLMLGEYLRQVLEVHGWNRTLTATALGMRRTHIPYLMQRYGVRPPDDDTES